MQSSKITLLTSVGTGLEYYDLVIYSLLAKFISQQFFPSSDPTASLFATFAVFALSYVVRPLGGVIFGILGDRFGRKNIFANTLLWMGGVTFLMGLIPSYSTLGLTATIFFIICRILQGLAFGANLPGAVTLLSEHIDPKKHGLHFGFMLAAVTLGVSFGSSITWSLTQILTQDEIASWGFRIPFLLGGTLALVGFYIRRHLPETPTFLNSQKTAPILSGTIIKTHIRQVVNIMGILLFPASLVTFQLIFPVYLHDFYPFSFADIYLSLTCGYIWCAIWLPIFGWISDKIGRKVMIIAASLLMIIFIYPVFGFLQTGERWALFNFNLFAQTIIAIMTASYMVLLPPAFQTIVRYRGIAFSYNITYSITTFLPLLVNYIYRVLNDLHYLMWMFMLLATLAIISTLILKPKYDTHF